jgi:sec-independent protein translocase protein TatA
VGRINELIRNQKIIGVFMGIGMGELLLILVIVFVLFGAGKLPQVMGDLGKGIKSLKKGLKEEEKSDKSSIEDKSEKQ